MHWLLLLVLVSLVEATFRVDCYGLVHERVDPLIAPNQVSPHAHAAFGSSSFAPNATAASLRNETFCSSCDTEQDNSNYWAPSVFFQWANGSFSSLPYRQSIFIATRCYSHPCTANAGIYYRALTNQTKAFPPGFGTSSLHFI